LNAVGGSGNVTGRKGRILVVDPEASVREGLRKVLEIDGYEVSEAVS
jgi:CheY-like chemotaxis protein